jgi:hypothetical protein
MLIDDGPYRQVGCKSGVTDDAESQAALRTPTPTADVAMDVRAPVRKAVDNLSSTLLLEISGGRRNSSSGSNSVMDARRTAIDLRDARRSRPSLAINLNLHMHAYFLEASNRDAADVVAGLIEPPSESIRLSDPKSESGTSIWC